MARIAQASTVVVSCLLLLAVLAYFLRTAIRLREGQETLDWRALWFDKAAAAKRIVLLALTVIYVLALESLGITLATTIFIFLGIVLPSLFAPAIKRRWFPAR